MFSTDTTSTIDVEVGQDPAVRVAVEVGGWDHACCGAAIERNQLVDLGGVRTTGPDGHVVLSEVRHDVGPRVQVRGRVTDLLVVRPDGTSAPIHRLPSGGELTPLVEVEVAGRPVDL